jgi:hypothetical protein
MALSPPIAATGSVKVACSTANDLCPVPSISSNARQHDLPVPFQRQSRRLDPQDRWIDGWAELTTTPVSCVASNVASARHAHRKSLGPASGLAGHNVAVPPRQERAQTCARWVVDLLSGSKCIDLDQSGLEVSMYV